MSVQKAKWQEALTQKLGGEIEDAAELAALLRAGSQGAADGLDAAHNEIARLNADGDERVQRALDRCRHICRGMREKAMLDSVHARGKEDGLRAAARLVASHHAAAVAEIAQLVDALANGDVVPTEFGLQASTEAGEAIGGVRPMPGPKELRNAQGAPDGA